MSRKLQKIFFETFGSRWSFSRWSLFSLNILHAEHSSRWTFFTLNIFHAEHSLRWTFFSLNILHADCSSNWSIFTMYALHADRSSRWLLFECWALFTLIALWMLITLHADWSVWRAYLKPKRILNKNIEMYVIISPTLAHDEDLSSCCAIIYNNIRKNSIIFLVQNLGTW